MNNALLFIRGLNTAFATKAAGYTPALMPIVSNLKNEIAIDKFLVDSPSFQLQNIPGVFQDWSKKFEFEVRYRDWYGNIKMNRTDYDLATFNLPKYFDDKLNQAAENYSLLPDKLIYDLLVANGNAFDGTALFATSRPNFFPTNETVDNLKSGSGVDEGYKIIADLTTAKNEMLSWHFENDIPVNGSNGKWYVVIPRHLNIVFDGVLKSNTYITSDGVVATNPHVGSFTPIENLYQSGSDNDWYVVYLKSGMEPFVLKTNKAPKWTNKEDDESDTYQWFSKATINAAAAWPTSILKVNN